MSGGESLKGYEWSDGSAANYFNWNQNGEIETDAYCTVVEESGHWHHSLCNETLGFVCQVPRPQKNCLQGHGHSGSFYIEGLFQITYLDRTFTG